MKKVLFAASVVKTHICHFHLPYIKWFSDMGWLVHVCAKNDFPKDEECVIPCCDGFFDTDFSRSPVSADNLRAYRQVKTLIDSENYDLILASTPIAAAVVRMAARDARKGGTKVIYICHGFHFYKGAPFPAGIYREAERFLAGFTDGTVTINREDKEAADSFSPKGKCYLIHGMGVDINAIENAVCDRAALRKEFGIPENAFLLMSVSEINKNKNVITAIKAFEKACEKNPAMYYLICGCGSMEEECRQAAAGNIIFAGYRRDIYILLHIADAFIFPSFREGLGLAAIEAMAAGLPLIASNIRGVREFAVQGENSLLCPPSDVNAFSEAILSLADNADLRETLGNEGKKAAMPFDIKYSFGELTDIFREYMGEEETAQKA